VDRISFSTVTLDKSLVPRSREEAGRKLSSGNDVVATSADCNRAGSNAKENVALASGPFSGVGQCWCWRRR
jgi:hypothetical protein